MTHSIQTKTTTAVVNRANLPAPAGQSCPSRSWDRVLTVPRGINICPPETANLSFGRRAGHVYSIPKDGRTRQEYFDKNMPVVNERLFLAGVRLGRLLNVIFDETKELPF